MSCNPAIGGLAKGQLVREIDALGGLMGLATDATGIQFKMLNASKGQAVFGPRAQCDKHAYAETVQAMIRATPEIELIAGSVEELDVHEGTIRGVVVREPSGRLELTASAVVLTTGTFMRGLMHTGEARTEGGRFGEAAAIGISGSLAGLGFELGRLKTGTPPRLRRGTLDWDGLPADHGDAAPVPFSDLTATRAAGLPAFDSIARFPVITQVECRQTHTTAASHDLIRANLHRAPMFTGQIEGVGPRYCPSIEDKVVRFAQRDTHGVFLEPESLRDDWIYCNGISTSLPAEVQSAIVRSMPGCERAEILRFGYAVEYDMVRPHQILPTGMTRLVRGLFLAGQINGTSGYEEAAAQGLVAGVNAVLFILGEPEFILGRDQAYMGVLMDDLVTKAPVEPYRMFTSRAEYRLLLRADNAPDRLTPLADSLGLLTGPLGDLRRSRFAQRRTIAARLNGAIDAGKCNGVPVDKAIRTPTWEAADFDSWLWTIDPVLTRDARGHRMIETAYADRKYAPFVERARNEIERQAQTEHRSIPDDMPYNELASLRTEARVALTRFRPRTFGQAGRLEGITPADLTLLSVLVKKHRKGGPRDQRVSL